MNQAGGQFTPKILTVLRNGYGPGDFRADFIAGLTVAIVALPLAMALGIASGASPDKGLITAVVAGFLISLLGGSRVQIGGPTGAFVVVIFNVIAAHGYDGLVLATLLAGLMLIIAGYAKLGQVIRYIPHPVITGFTAGIAVIIATSQVKDFLGLKIENPPADFIPKWSTYLDNIDSTNLTTLGVGLSALGLIIFLRKIAPQIPGYLVAVILSSVAVAYLHLPVETIGSRFPDIPAGLPTPQLPDWSFEKIKEVLPAAFTIAFLAGIEALLSAVVADGMTGFRHRSNQELVGQGVANIASSLFGGMPATGAIARTATNIKSGGRSPIAGMLHAVFLLLFVLYGTHLMAFVPMATLAAILFIVAAGMSEAGHFLHIFRISKSDRIVMLLTFLLTVLVDLTVAIGVGVTLASLLFVARMSKVVEIKTRANDASIEDEDQRIELPQGVEVFRITGPMFFGIAGELTDVLKRIGPMPKILIIRMKFVPYLDTSGVNSLESVVKKCRASNTKIIFSAVQKQPAEILSKVGLGLQSKDVRHAADYASAIKLARQILEDQSVSA